jgi:hypothetical protein
LKLKFILQRSNGGVDEEGFIDDLYAVRILGDGFAHQLFPHIFYLQGLNVSFEPALPEKLL